jgi:hypothetical protein
MSAAQMAAPKNRGTRKNSELDKIYDAARNGGRQDSMMSDWEIDSELSDLTAMSNLTGRVQNGKKVRGLESIYLQRLEQNKKG